jgi:hypothetical protein
MNIEFVDEKTVKITESLDYEGTRPDQKKSITRPEIVKKFKKKHPLYIVEEAEGPYRISNYISPESSTGTWILTVEKIKKTKTTSKRRPKSAPKIIKEEE